MPRHPPRSRIVCATVILVTIALGLASRWYAEQLPRIVGTYGGDVLWAAMVYWAAAGVFPRAKIRWLATGAYALSVAVEVSQLYHAPWIDAVRGTTLGALALGHGFLWSDLVCYAVGIAAAASVDWAVGRPGRTRRVT